MAPHSLTTLHILVARLSIAGPSNAISEVLAVYDVNVLQTSGLGML